MAVLDRILFIIIFLCLAGIVTWVLKSGKDNPSDYFLSGRIFPGSVMGIDLRNGAIGLLLQTGIFTQPGGLKGILTISVLLPNIHIKHGFTDFSVLEEQIGAVGNKWIGWHVVNSPGV
jgi:hypothetical protein